MAKIELQEVTKWYQKGFALGNPLHLIPSLLRKSPTPQADPPSEDPEAVLALDKLNLLVRDSETMAIVGPSGCGKSTLLRVVAGLTDYEGHVTYDDRDVQDIPVGERRIGMVFQSYALYPHFYGHGNLRFFFRVNKAPDAEAEARIQATADIMGFGFRELLKRKPGTLSGGQQQRLAIARALVRQPRLFLFDEPLSNLDAKLRTQTRVEIKRLLHRFSITALYVTHDQAEAMALGDRVAVMRRGHIEQVGRFTEILNRPQNAFVAGFLGMPPMNLVSGVVSDAHIVLGDRQRIPLPERRLASVVRDQQITVGIRAQDAYVVSHADITPTSPETGAATPEDIIFNGTIEVIEPDFGRRQQLVYVNTGAFTCSVTAPLAMPLATGYDIAIGFPSTALHLFDTVTGERVS